MTKSNNGNNQDKTGKERGETKPVFITQNQVMKELLAKIKLVAKTRATLLITGENGTGKEVMARMAHYYSSRSDKEMISVNCGAIPSDLVESELFGHEKGAFTGASEKKKGCFELADKSTLFLDEIGEMPKDMQVKLLRAVEMQSFRRVGGKKEINVDVSIISATNKILIDEVKSGNFREDLYYRLNVIELYIPPLRNRREDIPLLVSYFSNHFADTYNMKPIEFSEECMDIFTSYGWPGNVRELKNIVERCAVLCEGEKVQADAIPSHLQAGDKVYPVSPKKSEFDNYIQVPVGVSLEEVERKVINQTLSSVDNNKTEASKILGFSRKTLHNKLEKYEGK
ncbi:two-component system, NtrC family, response regulator [Fodinibius roseus]|uniref:Two-component system, NtrC family, response regulator n=1 Tax=Fodinibius roseus TaxID=1194090 RepID=A0A1M5F6T6_9BACT|nr:sigma-54 dependent transcriptional regulator [Fodinibius roseus]SHF87229.1 two-component system, NtrC family, response regulator [Fodinibius roseus]